MKASLIGTTSSGMTAGTTQYQPFVTQMSSTSWASSLTAGVQAPLPHAITLDRLRVVVATAPGVGKNLVIVVLKNGSATGITCTISGTATSAQDLTHTASYSAADTITFQSTLDTGGTDPGTTYWSARQDASGMFAILGSLSGTATGFLPIMGANANSMTSGDSGVIAPCAGTVQSLFLNCTASAANFTVYLNGVAQTLATGVMGAATASDITHSFAVAAGDRILIRNTGTGRASSWGVSFLPTTDGQSFVGAVGNGNTSTSATNYVSPINVSGGPGATESVVQMILPACTMLGIYAQTSTSPGVAPKAYTFTARQNAANTSAAVTINDATSTPNDGTSGREGKTTGLTITVNDDDLFATSIAPASTPIGCHVYVSYLISMTSGSTAWTQSVNATFSASGVLVKQTSRANSAIFSTSGVLSKVTARLLTANFSDTGILSRFIAKAPFTATHSASGVLSKQQQRTLTATFSTAGQLIGRAATRLLTAVFSSSGSLNRRAARTLTASHSAAGTLTKQTNKTPFTATFSSSGVVSGAHGVAKLLTATYIATGQLTNRTLARSFIATYSAAGNLARLLSRPLAGTFSTSGSLSRSSGIAPFVATLVASGALSRLPGKSLSGTYSASGQLTKQPRKSFTATFSSAGSLVKSLARALAGVFSGSGSLAGVKIGGHNQSFTATFSTAGNITNRSIGRQHTATYQTSGNLNKTTARRLTATASTAGNLVGSKILHKVLTATFSASGTLVRTAGKLLTASYSTIGSLLSAVLPGPIKLPAHWIQVFIGNVARYILQVKNTTGWSKADNKNATTWQNGVNKNGTQWQQRDDGADTAWKQTGGDKS